MSSAGADDNDFGGIEWALRAVGMKDGNLRPRLQRDARAGCERFVDFDGDDAAVRAG